MPDTIIDRIERWGYPEPEPEPVCCPICGDECERYYVQDGAIIGCEHCIDIWDADEWED